MPNWCNNQVRMGGPTKEIKRIWDILEDDKTDNGLLSAIAPLDGDWEYNDAVTNWGTKWDIKGNHGLELDEGETYSEITGYFDSAWSPPTVAFQTWLENNPNCDADLLYCEFANDFMGTLDAGDFTISQCSVSWLLGDPVGTELEDAFGIIEMKEELLEFEHEEALEEPLTLQDPETEV